MSTNGIGGGSASITITFNPSAGAGGADANTKLKDLPGSFGSEAAGGAAGAGGASGGASVKDMLGQLAQKLGLDPDKATVGDLRDALKQKAGGGDDFQNLLAGLKDLVKSAEAGTLGKDGAFGQGAGLPGAGAGFPGASAGGAGQGGPVTPQAAADVLSALDSGKGLEQALKGALGGGASAANSNLGGNLGIQLSASASAGF